MTGDPAPRPLVSSVVLSYNNFDDTDECIESLARQTYTPHEIVLVDNDSTDGSIGRLAGKWSDRVRVVRNVTNTGVAEGYNAGIRESLDLGAGFVIVCNNDIVVEPNFVEVLAGVLEEDERIAMACPLTVYHSRPDVVWFAGIALDRRLGFTRNLLRGQQVSRVDAGRRFWDSDYVLTHATMLRRSALEQAGALDSRFFYGYDDVDYSLRLRDMGFRCVTVSGTTVKHKVSVTAGTGASSLLRPDTAFTFATGTVLLGAKHYSGRRAPLFLVGLTVRAAYTAGQMLAARGWSSAASYIKGLSLALVRYAVPLVTGSEARRSPEHF